jgi:hypothetical protein
MVLSRDIHYLQVELRQELMPSSSPGSTANHLVEILVMPVLQTFMVSQDLDLCLRTGYPTPELQQHQDYGIGLLLPDTPTDLSFSRTSIQLPTEEGNRYELVLMIQL